MALAMCLVMCFGRLTPLPLLWSVVLMVIVIALTVVQFRFVERKVQY